jgi:hypothetical protein
MKMPLGKGVRYRRKGKMRLAFKGNKVIEAKNMETGDVHTPEEFAADKKKRSAVKHARKARD